MGMTYWLHYAPAPAREGLPLAWCDGHYDELVLHEEDPENNREPRHTDSLHLVTCSGCLANLIRVAERRLDSVAKMQGGNRNG